VRKLVLSTGIVTTLAGSPTFNSKGATIGGFADGAATASLFNQPYGIAFDTAASNMVIIVRCGGAWVCDRGRGISSTECVQALWWLRVFSLSMR